jgi:hypothetical protein
MRQTRRRLAAVVLAYVQVLAHWLARVAAPTWRWAANGRLFYRGVELTARPLERWSDVVKRDPCAYCGGRSDTEEHVIPRSKGGSNQATNIVGACRACNAAKKDQPLLQFLIIRRRERFTRHVRQGKAKRNLARRMAKRQAPLAASLAEHTVLQQFGGHA